MEAEFLQGGTNDSEYRLAASGHLEGMPTTHWYIWTCPDCPIQPKRHGKRKSFDTWDEALESLIVHMRADADTHPSCREGPEYLRHCIKKMRDYRPSPPPPSREPKRRKEETHNSEGFTPRRNGYCEVYIGNIAIAGASIAGLHNLAKEYGNIDKIRILYEDPWKVYAFVLFSKPGDALNCVEGLHSTVYHGRKLSAFMSELSEPSF